jgi:arylsulfatase A-like enzyme
MTGGVRRLALWWSLLAGIVVTSCDTPRRQPRAIGNQVALSSLENVAERRSPTGTIDFGAAQARGLLGRGWSVDEVWQPDTTFVWGIGESSEILVSVFHESDVVIRFRCRPLMGSQGPVTPLLGISLNETLVAMVPLTGGDFNNYEVTIAKENVSPAENRLTFHYGETAGRPDVPATETRDLRVAWDWLRVGDGLPTDDDHLPKSSGAELVLPVNSQVDFYLDLPPESVVAWDGVTVTPSGGSPPVTLEVAVADDHGNADKARVSITGHGRGRWSWTVSRAASYTRVSLMATTPEPPDSGDKPRYLVLRGARVVGPSDPVEVAQSRLFGAGVSSADQPAACEPANIVIYLIDTLRPDHLGVHGYGGETSPVIDRFTRDAVLYSRAVAQSSWTKTSAASILTGLLPTHHDTYGRNDILPQDISTYVPARLASSGYQTVAVSASAVVSPEFGFDRGFDEFSYVEPQIEHGTHAAYSAFAYSHAVTDRFVDWLQHRRSATKPFFAYIHTLDPHDPYGPPDTYRPESRFAHSPLSGLRRYNDVRSFLVDHPKFTRDDVRDHFLSLYDADIQYNDAQFGRLMGVLRENDLYDSTLIILVSDHGEEFLEHAYWGHGHTLYDELVRVPLIVKFPHQAHAGLTVPSTMQHVDVASTILEAAGQPLSDDLAGRSLQSVVEDPTCLSVGTQGCERPVYSALRLDGRDLESLIYRDLHLICRRDQSTDERCELYAFHEDPRESDNLGPERPATSGYLSTLLRLSRQTGGPVYQSEAPAIDAETEDRLRALGYVE